MTEQEAKADNLGNEHEQEVNTNNMESEHEQEMTADSMRSEHEQEANTDIEIEHEQEANTDFVQSNGDITESENKGTISGRKRYTELEKLKMGNGYESSEEFDAIGDDTQVHRKLREQREPRSLREPSPYKPKPKKSKKLSFGYGKRRRISFDAETALHACDKCPKDFPTMTGLLNHMRMHQTTLTYMCSLCNDTFDTNDALKDHKTVHNDENRVFLCSVCKMAFSDHCAFLVHSLKHFKRASYKCLECGYTYQHKESYKIHIYSHYHRKLKCPICSVEVNGEPTLAQHVNRHKQQPGKPCVECGKVCPTPAYMKYHMLSHTGVKPYQCLYCGKGFRNNSQRRIHTRSHTGERPFACNLCNNTFTQYTDLERHKATHDKVQRYECDICQKKFFHKGSVVIHMRRHLNVGMYPCAECKDSFVTMQGLRTHTMFKHMVERPVKCEPCDQAFINNNQFQKHCKSKKHKRNEYGAKMKEEKIE